MRKPRLRRCVPWIGEPLLAADHLADVLPDGRLRDEVDVRVGVRLPALALEDPARLPSSRRIARARYRVAELAVGILRVLFHNVRAVEPLLIPELHAAEVEDTVLHRRQNLLTATGRIALVERGDDTEREMQPGSGIADLRAGDHRRAVVEPRR